MTRLSAPQLELLRMMAKTAQRQDMDVGLGANVLLALLDEVEAARRVVRGAIDQALANLMTLANLNDDATMDSIIRHTADTLGAALDASKRATTTTDPTLDVGQQ